MNCPGITVEEAMMKINTLGTISLTKTVLPSMIEKKQGHVVIISSLAGKIGETSQKGIEGGGGEGEGCGGRAHAEGEGGYFQ